MTPAPLTAIRLTCGHRGTRAADITVAWHYCPACGKVRQVSRDRRRRGTRKIQRT